LADCYLGDDITPADARQAVAGTGLHLHEPDRIEDVVAGLLGVLSMDVGDVSGILKG
jgi:carbamoyltransferase